MNPQKLTKWKKWLGDANTDGTISRELSNLAVVRMVFAGIKYMVETNPALQQHSAFHSVFSSTYAHSVMMYVRRQVREDRDSCSLINLARDLRDNCQIITKDYFVSLYTSHAADEYDRDEREQWGQSDFYKYFGGTAKTYLDPAIIESDIADLKAIADASASFIDRRLAHLDLREPTSVPTYDELDNWCDMLNAKLKKYFLLLYASDLQVAPVLQHNWQAIFRVPWLPESSPG